MSRWWTDPDQARSVLGRVNDSDVVQGVGTAVLGYHGLAVEKLKPLTQRTLVDVAQVSKALGQVDLGPVAKALAEATRPVMGEASGEYGRLLAEDLHEQAVASTERLVSSLSSMGMPFPTAITRAVSVHGVPVSRLGPTGNLLKTPAMSPIVLDDVADRALMDYASRVGRREATGSEVSKAGEFDERDHRRDALGRFTDKPDTAGTDEVAARRARQEKRQKRLKRVANRNARVADMRTARERKAQTVAEARPMSLAERMRATRSDAPAAVEAQVGAAEQAVVDRGQQRRERMREVARNRARAAIRRVLDTPPPPPPKDKLTDPLETYPMQGGHYVDAYKYRMPRGEMRYYLVHRDVLKKVTADGGFAADRLNYFLEANDLGHVMALSKGMVETELAGVFRANAQSNYGLLVFADDIAIANGFEPDEDHAMIAAASRWKVRETLAFANDDGMTIGDEHGVGRNAVPGDDNTWHPVKMPYVLMRLSNDDQFTDYMEKADRDFDERDHRRDALGRFTDKPEDRQARQDRRQKRLKRLNRVQSRREAVVAARQERQKASQTAQESGKVFSLAERLRQSQGAQRAAEEVQSLGMSGEDRRQRLRQIAQNRARSAARQRLQAVWDAEEEGPSEDFHLMRLTFGDVSAMDWFGLDPFNGKNPGQMVDDRSYEDEEFLTDYLLNTVRPAPEVLDKLHQESVRQFQRQGAGIPAASDERDSYENEEDALTAAMWWLNDNQDDIEVPRGMVAEPYAEVYQEGVEIRYRPMYAAIPSNPEDILLYATPEDFRRVLKDKSPFDITEFNGGKPVWFDEQMARYMPAEQADHRKYRQRSDFMVRAFRLKVRENNSDWD